MLPQPRPTTPDPGRNPRLPRRTPGRADLRVFTTEVIRSGRHRLRRLSRTGTFLRDGHPVLVRFTTLATAALCVLTTVTGCSGSTGPAAAASGGGLEKTRLTVRVLPVADMAPLYLAIRNGYFTAEGLTITPRVIQKGDLAIQALRQGDLDIAVGNYVSFFTAQARGAHLKIIADGYQAKQNTQVVVTLPGSPIRRVSDLAGKRIGVSTLSNVAQLATMSALDVAGVNPRAVKFVQVDNPNMATALRTGLIDAAYELEPFLSADQQHYGVVKLFDAMSGPTANLAISGYATTTSWAAKNPNTFAAFQRAMHRGQVAAADRAAVEKILPTYTSINANTAAEINLGTYPTSISQTRLARVLQLMVTYRLVPDESTVDLPAMLANATGTPARASGAGHSVPST